jgi:hypothetical protein
VSLGCALALLTFNILAGGLLTEYVFEFWLSYLKEVPVNIPFWICIIAGLFIGQFVVPAAMVTLLFSFAL